MEVFHSYCGTLLRWNSELSDKVRCKNGKIMVLNEVEVELFYIVFTEKNIFATVAYMLLFTFLQKKFVLKKRYSNNE